jgi:hypothetical protein
VTHLGVPGLKDGIMFRRYIGSLAMAAAISAANPAIAGPKPQDHTAAAVEVRQQMAPVIAPHRAISIPLFSASFHLYPDPGVQPLYFSHLFLGAKNVYRATENPLPIDEMKTTFFSRSTLALAQLWSGRVQLDAFQSALRIQNAQLSPGGLRSLHLSGLSLSLHFGRNARASQPAQSWRRLPRMVGSVLD